MNSTPPRPAEGRDAILGVAPRLTYSPASAEECTGVMAECAREKLRVGFVGGATELSLGHRPEGLDAVIRTRGMGRVLEYAPSDMVISVEAGATLAQVQEVTRSERQMLALDPPLPDRATLGGLVATGAFGPRRARYGAVRDLIIGVSLVRADGVMARGGGKVVKNVAGFDLPKVACGSLGTLGLVAAATFRLHPLPDSSATALFPGLTAHGVVALIQRMRQRQLEPTGAVAVGAGPGPFDLGVRFEGFERGVAQQMARAAELGGMEALSETGAAAFWTRQERARTIGALRIKVASLPTRLPAVSSLLMPLLDSLRGSTFTWYATLGLGFAAGEVADAGAAIAALEAARSGLCDQGGSLVVADAPAEMRGVDPWGPRPGSFPLMAELKQRFDPEGRLNPGRFIGGL